MSKRPLEEFKVPVNETGKAVFVRDSKGDLVTVLPGAPLPARAQAASDAAREAVAKAEVVYEAQRLKERTPEEAQYEAYLASKQNKGGNVWIPNVGHASSDRAAFVDSLAAEVAEHRAEGKQYAPSRAFDRSRSHKAQKSGGASGYLGGTSVEAARVGAAAASKAMARALEASDDEEDSMAMNAVQLANRAMEMYNLPISSLAQADVHGNDLRLPKLQRKLRKFLECFAEDICVRTATGAVVLKDFEAMKKRYMTVFRESGAELKGEVRRRWYFEKAAEPDADEEEGTGDTFTIDFERHTHLVTPRPGQLTSLPFAHRPSPSVLPSSASAQPLSAAGLPLDGSMGVLPARTQDLIVLYHASANELAGMWIAPDTANLGGDPNATQQSIEESEVFKSLKAVVERMCGGEELQVHYNSYLE
ncbi:hypothetical protein AB1Y20_023473 [Prymnesium parvum]|uniref:Uncharacterized protein n=1 Tax=Prymnesium parvum TaxID=97485 RepID=A0AB34JGY5_PRYPA